ncbi:hypothetical protein NW767_015100 [Fusarium falciforme]|jgi:hypothetical protein|nr:hypothetical protein NW767_015100 [Fusarium falciforme]
MAFGSPVLFPLNPSGLLCTAEVAYRELDTDKSDKAQAQLDYFNDMETIERYITWPSAQTQTSFSHPSDENSGNENLSKNNVREKVKLRCSSRKPKNRTRKPAIPERVLRARNRHNNVERTYRTRLKLHFENLLATLQESPAGLNHPGLDISGRSFSRGEVLDAARRRILTLEKVNEQLATGNEQLLKDMVTMQ